MRLAMHFTDDERRLFDALRYRLDSKSATARLHLQKVDGENARTNGADVAAVIAFAAYLSTLRDEGRDDTINQALRMLDDAIATVAAYGQVPLPSMARAVRFDALTRERLETYCHVVCSREKHDVAERVSSGGSVTSTDDALALLDLCNRFLADPRMYADNRAEICSIIVAARATHAVLDALNESDD